MTIFLSIMTTAVVAFVAGVVCDRLIFKGKF